MNEQYQRNNNSVKTKTTTNRWYTLECAMHGVRTPVFTSTWVCRRVSMCFLCVRCSCNVYRRKKECTIFINLVRDVRRFLFATIRGSFVCVLPSTSWTNEGKEKLIEKILIVVCAFTFYSLSLALSLSRYAFCRMPICILLFVHFPISWRSRPAVCVCPFANVLLYIS